MNRKFATLRSLFAVHNLPYLLFLGATLFWLRSLFGPSLLPAEDLDGHVAVIKLLSAQLRQGRVFFYDTGWFTGWPVFQFYGFLPHLILALFSMPLSLMTTQPEEFLAALSIALGLGLLPVTFSYYARGFLEEKTREQLARSSQAKLLLALSSMVPVLFILTHPDEYYGMSAASIVHIGLFSQLFGWHLLLLYLGSLLRVLSGDAQRQRQFATFTAVFLALLVLTHILTFVYAIMLTGLAFLWFRRVVIFKSTIVGLLLAAFWLLPYFVLSAPFTLPDSYPAEVDVFQLLFHPGMRILFSRTGEPLVPNLLGFLLLTLISVLFFHHKLRRVGKLWPMLAGICLLAVALQSPFVAQSLPLALHYYRFAAYHLLCLLGILVVVPVISSARLLVTEELTIPRKLFLVWVALFVLCGASAVSNAPALSKAGRPNLHASDEIHRVVEYLRAEKGARVLVEHFKDYQRYADLSCHYLMAHLPAQAGVEVINGLFVESSLAFRFPAVVARMLGGDVYHSFLIFTKGYDASDAEKVEQLKRLGVTHIVAGSEEFKKRLAPFAARAQDFGVYRVVQLKRAEQGIGALVEEVQRPVLAYYDAAGGMPFIYLQFYFFARQALFKEFELIEVSSLEKVPEVVSMVLVNGAKSANFPQERQIAIALPREDEFSHSQPNYPLAPSVKRYRRLAKYLDQQYLDRGLRLPQLLSAVARGNSLRRELAPEISWSAGEQQFALKNLQVGQAVRINYTYSPLFKSQEGEIYRALGERIFFVPNAAGATLQFNFAGHWSAISGVLLSLGAGSLLFLLRK